MSTTDNAELFIQTYIEFEKLVRGLYDIPNNETLYKSVKDHYSSEEYRLYDICQSVRNALQHDGKLGGCYVVQPSEQLICAINQLLTITKNRFERKNMKCYQIAIKFGDVYWQGANDKVNSSIRIMREKLYTHTPILDENHKVIGVFDENSVFNYLADNEIIEIGDELHFSDIEKYLSLDDREMESFQFIKAGASVEMELMPMFRRQFNNHKRLEMIFVTPSGKQDDILTGIITPWDVLGMEL